MQNTFTTNIHPMQKYLKKKCSTLSKCISLTHKDCDDLLDASTENPLQLFKIFWVLNTLCTIKQLSVQFKKTDLITLLGVVK